VEFLSGDLTAYRKEAFKDLKFDEYFLDARLYTDDGDFSFRLSRKYQNVYTPYARVAHNPPPIGRVNHRTRAKMRIEARYYMLMKNFPRTPNHTLAFWWLVIGLFIQAITTMDNKVLKA
jgi:hypothetical protein